MNIKRRIQKLEQAKPSATCLGQATVDFLWNEFGIRWEPRPAPTEPWRGTISPEIRALLDDLRNGA